MTAISVDAQEAARQITLHVRLHGAQMLRFRTWLGAHFIRLGAWVIGCGIVIEQDGESLLRSGLEAQASTINLKPGDVVVIELQQPIPREGHERIAADIRRVFGEDRKVLVLDRASIKVVSKD